jgi:hypothetical protein
VPLLPSLLHGNSSNASCWSALLVAEALTSLASLSDATDRGWCWLCKETRCTCQACSSHCSTQKRCGSHYALFKQKLLCIIAVFFRSNFRNRTKTHFIKNQCCSRVKAVAECDWQQQSAATATPRSHATQALLLLRNDIAARKTSRLSRSGSSWRELQQCSRCC